MILTLFESVQKAYTRPNQIIEAEWPVIADFLMQHNPAKTKEEVPLFNLWQFKTQDYELGRRRIYEEGMPTERYETIQGTIRRCKNNSVALHGLVLDYDGTRTIDEAVGRLRESEIEAVVYTTFRNTPETNKFRIVLPFSEPLPVTKIRAKRAAIQETFPEVDNASFSESQSFYLHSGAVPYTQWIKGTMLNPNWFEDEVIPEVPKIEASYKEFTGDRDTYKQKLIDSLLTCSGLHYASDKSHLGVLTLVALCKSAEMTFTEYDTVCWHMAAGDSSLQNPAQRKSAWYGWAPHSGITAKVREEFIKSYGGKSKFLEEEKQLTSNDLIKNYEEKYGRRIKHG